MPSQRASNLSSSKPVAASCPSSFAIVDREVVMSLARPSLAPKLMARYSPYCHGDDGVWWWERGGLIHRGEEGGGECGTVRMVISEDSARARRETTPLWQT